MKTNNNNVKTAVYKTYRRPYTDLKMNPGNLNAWLKHGDGNKISLDRARDVLRYLSETN
jgi:hypothetical protein